MSSLVHSETPVIERDPFDSFRPQSWWDRKNYEAKHRVKLPPVDDGSPIQFRWHFPPGTLAPRMSAKELGTFLLTHLRPVMILFVDKPRVFQEWLTIVTLFETQVPNAPEMILPWVQSVERAKTKGDSDLIVLDLNQKNIPERKMRVFY